MSYVYKNLVAYTNTGSGAGEFIWVAPLRWFNLVEEPAAPFVNEGDEVVIYNTHSFLDPAYGFVKYLLAPDKNQLSGRTTGALGSQKQTFEAQIFLPGSYVQVHEAIKNLLNEPLIALQPDADCTLDLIYQLGTRCNPAFLKADFTTGTTIDGVKGYSVTLTYTGPGLYIYDGDVQLASGTPAAGLFAAEFANEFE